MSDETFENLEVWQDAIAVAARVYEMFRSCRDFDFRNQIQRASVSISSNIAEGYERDSNLEFIRFLFIAKGSCAEVRSQALVAVRVNLLTAEQSEALATDVRRLSRRIMALINARREKFG